jgi:thiamine-phosphate pyrophosphorylase
MSPQPQPRQTQTPLAPPPLLYLITSGRTTKETTPATEAFRKILQLIQAAVDAEIDLVQIREKNLRPNVLYELVANAAGVTKGTATRLLVNDRADVAAAAGADGVHLTTASLRTDVVRRTFGGEFLLGVSTHSLAEASLARSGGADFVVFGPVFDTAAKKQYGEAPGLDNLARVSAVLAPFPVLALGGLTTGNVADCVRAGARGVAAIGMFDGPERLSEVVDAIRARFQSLEIGFAQKVDS